MNKIKFGVINANEQIIANFEYSSIQKISNTNLLLATKANNNMVDIISKDGKITECMENGRLNQENNYVEIYTTSEKKYFDLDGNETTYSKLFPNNKLYASKKNGKWGFVDINGNVVVNYAYDNVTEMSNGFAGICVQNKWGVINENGQVILEPTYELQIDNPKFLSTYYESSNSDGVIFYCADK